MTATNHDLQSPPSVLPPDTEGGAPPSPEPDAPDRPDVALNRILYVEDDSTSAKIVQTHLQKEGYSVTVVGDGAGWERSLGEGIPDLCLIDLTLPDSSGLELLGRLREMNVPVPAVIVTASGAVQDVVSAMRLGAVDYLTKPIDTHRLAVSVRNALKLSRQQEEIDQLLREAGRKGPRVDVDAILTELVKRGGSDLHLKIGRPPLMRIAGELNPSEFSELDDADMQAVLRRLLGSEGYKALIDQCEYDTSYTVRGVARFRINAFKRMGQFGAVLRSIPLECPTLDSLGLPEVIRNICEAPQGLVLVTGPTGSGKSTTLAAMMEHMNRTQALHIVTIEDPVEFIYTDKKCTINQRQLGNDVRSLKEALRRALRQDPDVILVGEMRDQETIELAMHAAETGHLVFSTLHTNDAKQTLDRIVDTFPPDGAHQIRSMLALTLQAVVSQRLVRRADGNGRAAAMEVMINTPNIRELIQNGKTSQIDKAVQQSSEYYKTQTFNMSLARMVKDEVITEEEATATSTNPGDLRLMIRGIHSGSAQSVQPEETPASAVDTKIAAAESTRPASETRIAQSTPATNQPETTSVRKFRKPF